MKNGMLIVSDHETTIPIGGGVKTDGFFLMLLYLLLSPLRVRFWHLRLMTGCQGICEPNLLPLLNNNRKTCELMESKIRGRRAKVKCYWPSFLFLFRPDC
jgi:hypothetical protein